MKTKQLLLSMLLGVSMTTLSAEPVNPTWVIHQDVAFSEVRTASGTQVWGDYNNDDLLDYLIVAGQGSENVSKLYKNLGNGNFEEVDIWFSQLALGSATWVDYNNDGNLDIIISGAFDGKDISTAIVEVWKNLGPENNYEFEEDLDNEVFPYLCCESSNAKGQTIACCDFDNDGWTDVLISGMCTTENPQRCVKLYKNNHGQFEEVSDAVGGNGFPAISSGTVQAADLNNDGLTDIVISGWLEGTGDANSGSVFINKGNLQFTEHTGIFHGQHQGSTFAIDINNDGYLDLIESGRNAKLLGWGHLCKVYVNSGDGITYTRLEEDATGLSGSNSAVAIGDLNADGYMDFISTGWSSAGNPTKIFLNNGDQTFTSADFPDVARARDGDVSIFDYNNDGRLDVSLFGYRDGGSNDDPIGNPLWPNFLWENTETPVNQAPSAPVLTSLVQDGNDVVLTWNASTDDITPVSALRYNVMARAKDGSTVFTYVPANPATGNLKFFRVGNFIQTKSFRFKNMKLADYDFGVQAVDQGFKASTFSTEVSGVDMIEGADMNVNVRNDNGYLTIINNSEDAMAYSVYASNGVCIENGLCGANASVKVLANTGVYVIKLQNDKNVVVKKVVL